jgi:ABC-type dipeptide/oligopeptide/nickel transport system ATPase component
VDFPDPDSPTSPTTRPAGTARVTSFSTWAEPKLVIADEITSALDVSVQADIIQLLQGMRGTVDSAMLFISHNLAVVQEVCDDVVVMFQGRIVEQGTIDSVYRDPQHEYTRNLLASVPGSPEFSLD